MIHDITSTDLINYHVDGMGIFGGENIIVRQNRFYGNMITNILVKNCCGNLPIRNLTVENNWFGTPLNGSGVASNANGVDIESQIAALRIRFNSFADGGYTSFNVPQVDAEFAGNLFTNAACATGVSYSYNVFVPYGPYIGQSACGSTDKRVSSLGLEPDGVRLLPSSPALDYVPSGAGCPSVDLNGTTRSQDGYCDAGAYEG